ncbi:serine/arginine repetitive matrix protein 1-like isoform X2 [Mustela erminea]|uniref:serine/arginine repetitive matrix protein 1-like isoform X2 n=1 Tax=Mustela erminea TaxID=36723 RepID=UPI001386CD61|nr:serine/arginine repetitive matrix protein 1-like isoform X2 [Mustela erminea]
MCTISLMAGAGSALWELALRTAAATAGRRRSPWDSTLCLLSTPDPGSPTNGRGPRPPRPRPLSPRSPQRLQSPHPRASPSRAAPPPILAGLGPPFSPGLGSFPTPPLRQGSRPGHPAARAPPRLASPWAIFLGQLPRGSVPGGRTERGTEDPLLGKSGREKSLLKRVWGRRETGFGTRKWSVRRDSDTRLGHWLSRPRFPACASRNTGATERQANSAERSKPCLRTWRQLCLCKSWLRISFRTWYSPDLALNSSPPASPCLLDGPSWAPAPFSPSSRFPLDMTLPHRENWGSQGFPGE